jgi:hypothetical protein
MEGIHRDVFIVHSEGDEREAALYGALIPQLVDIDISVWHYEDWNWEHQVHRRGRGAYRSSGRVENLDSVAYSLGSRMPFRAPIDEVDESTLAIMLHESKVALMCEPRDGVASEGVLKERQVLANLTAGPLLVHVLWSDSSGDFFAPLRPALEVRLADTQVSVAVVDEVFAAVLSAWLVHTLQIKWGREGGQRLLAKASRGERALKILIERSPRNSDLEALARPGNAPDLAGKLIREVFNRLDQFQGERFAEWWTDYRGKLLSCAEKLQDGVCVRLLRQLLSQLPDCGV